MDEVRADRLWQHRVRVESERIAHSSMGNIEELTRLEEGINQAMYSTTNDIYYGNAQLHASSVTASLERELKVLRVRRRKAEEEVKRLKAVLDSLG